MNAQKYHNQLRTIQVVKVVEPDKVFVSKIPIEIRKRQKTKRGIFMKSHKVLETSIDTQQKLADTIRNLYGFGVFVVMFISGYHRNKKYKENFVCIGSKCKHYDTCKVRRRKDYHKGMSCKLNRKFKVCPVGRAKIEIISKSSNWGTNKDYEFKWFKERDNMKRLDFWKGDKNE